MIALAITAAAPACRFDPVSGVPADRDAAVDAAVDAVVIGDASDDWWNPAWSQRRAITIKSGDLTGPVQSFPLLVRLPMGVGRPGGEDLRFVATDQTTVLPHERDTGALVWVRIPEISNTEPAPVLWVYYGNGDAPSTSSGAAVFADGYVSVHHLGQGAGQTLPDATGHGHTASSAQGNVMPASRPDGRIGAARDFDGQDDYLVLAGEDAYDFTTSLSVSAWIRVENLDLEYQAIVAKGDRTWRIHRHEQTNFVGFGTTVDGNFQNQNGDRAIDGGQWRHVAIVLGSSTKSIYVDGQLDQADPAAPTIDTTDTPVSIGRNVEAPTGGQRFWNGDIDEVRISGAARDAHWMFAERHTVAAADFVQVGDEERRAP